MTFGVGLDLISGVLRALPVTVIGNPYVHPRLGQGDSGGATDARVGAGHDRQAWVRVVRSQRRHACVSTRNRGRQP